MIFGQNSQVLAARLEADSVIIETDSKICHDSIHELILPPP